MSSQEKPHFRFKQFSIWHDQCAMKVSTDGILLGAWSFLPDTTKTVLDIGTGTGLLSLMVAQRLNDRCKPSQSSGQYLGHSSERALSPPTHPSFNITAIELDPDASQQAKFNAEQSPWSDSITVINDNILRWTQTSSRSNPQTFDVIVCNPPYFSNSLNSANPERNQARHNDGLPFVDLITITQKHLNEEGLFHVILPVSEMDEFLKLAVGKNFVLSQKTLVKPNEKKEANRVLMTFKKRKSLDEKNRNVESYPIIVRTGQGQHHPSFVKWCHPFYLKM